MSKDIGKTRRTRRQLEPETRSRQGKKNTDYDSLDYQASSKTDIDSHEEETKLMTQMLKESRMSKLQSEEYQCKPRGKPKYRPEVQEIDEEADSENRQTSSEEEEYSEETMIPSVSDETVPYGEHSSHRDPPTLETRKEPSAISFNQDAPPFMPNVSQLPLHTSIPASQRHEDTLEASAPEHPNSNVGRPQVQPNDGMDMTQLTFMRTLTTLASAFRLSPSRWQLQ